MVKIKKNVSLLTVALASVASLVGCNEAKKQAKNEVLFWSTSSAEKVYQDQPVSAYDKIKRDAKIEITSFKGEHEAKQLIISPQNDVKVFDADVTDLQGPNGATISKEKVTIYAEKYMNMTQIYDTVSQAPIGRCPDGLVPIKNSLEYNDNKISGGKNQGLYIDVNVPFEAVPGTYTGILTVDIDGVKTEVPMSVNVLDVAVNQEAHSRSVFLDHWQFWNGEMDSTEAMYDKYHNALADYYLSPSYAIIESELSHTDAGIARYVNKTYDLVQNPKLNTINVPYGTAAFNGETSFDEVVMKRYIRAYFEKSVETNFNIIKKLVCYFGFIDEPYEFGLMNRVKVVCERYKICMAEIATELATKNTDSPIHDELIQSIRDLPLCITTQYQEIAEGYIDYYCPKANFYDTPEMRANYDFQREKWWYTCVEPHMPYPTYHMEDTLSSARSISWMMANYDIVGNLFWSVNVYAQLKNSGYQAIENYYTGNAARYSGCNGDGYLFYPGKQYGYDGPLPSLRIQAIRDGNEEYEVFYNLKNKIQSLDLDNKAFINMLTSSLYDGVKVIANSELMEKAKLTLGQLEMANNNGSDFIVSDFNLDKGNNKADLQFYAKEGSTIKVNGVVLNNGNSYKQGNLYEYTHNLSENNELKIEVTYGDKTNVVDVHLTGKALNFGPNQLKDCFEKYNSTVTTTIEKVEEQDMLKLSVGRGKDAKQSIKLNAPFMDQMVDGLKEITLNVYNPTSEVIKMSFGGRNNNNNYDNYYFENYELKPGMNTISSNTIYMKLKDKNNIKYFFMVFGDSTSKNEDAKDIYIKDISLVRK